MSTSWHYDLLLPDAAIEGMQATVKRLDDVTPKIDQHMQQAAQEIGQRVNKALDEYQGQSPIRGVTDKPIKAKADELEPPKGNELPGANVSIIELEQGKKGSWNKTLNGKLEANTTYRVGSYDYNTDEFGRVKSVSGKLDLDTVDRNKYQQSKAGATGGIKDGLVDDEGGHLIATIFKGPGEQINYAAMNGNLNKGAWKRMENKWAEALKETPPKEIDVNINAIYEENSKRPVAFDVTYIIDGKKKTLTFLNKAGG
ncbi:DNA/RNA non-specific endonuclease [Pseudoalteromonas sp. BMB]|uniref:DNA/RNA non-specific endonuclease n=1 Tax=Pseudoalteromonas sp. BMB TaxID=1874619 RepID=UPI0009F3E379|nr:DNA/RNA non-specific endonuclease [Pseudoalteromonas sp. BMB]